MTSQKDDNVFAQKCLINISTVFSYLFIAACAPEKERVATQDDQDREKNQTVEIFGEAEDEIFSSLLSSTTEEVSLPGGPTLD